MEGRGEDADFRQQAVQTDLQFVYTAQCITAFAYKHSIFEKNGDFRELAEKFDADYQALPAVKVHHETTETKDSKKTKDTVTESAKH